MAESKVETIIGGIASDHRGQIRFVNDFDMTEVRRFYIIKNSNTSLIRGWRGHRLEQRWFYVLSGVFSVDLVKIDDWKNPSRELTIENHVLEMDSHEILHVPAGYATAFRAMENDSELLVYADYGLDNVKNDDYTWDTDYFVNQKKNEFG